MHLADLVTELNGFCGGTISHAFSRNEADIVLVMSIFSALRYCLGDRTDYGNLWLALGFMPFGLFFDFFDGKVARWRKKSSLMGQELDSLADLVSQCCTRVSVGNTDKSFQISFGVAPAATAFAVGMRSPLDHLLLTYFVLCALTRLARFNVTVSVLPKDETGKS